MGFGFGSLLGWRWLLWKAMVRRYTCVAGNDRGPSAVKQKFHHHNHHGSS